ncbi:hypothetical protein CISIN_1g035286mg [Citrus sinensis]|uniref:Uncharacterized protein n=1 Tax=Citrus sinensis TaxID=2711 RepID=A0A067D4I4_CITSI|nr:hypothetical protein CISIN_1g035286mg [Citrus sinensis]
MENNKNISRPPETFKEVRKLISLKVMSLIILILHKDPKKMFTSLTQLFVEFIIFLVILDFLFLCVAYL